MLLQQVGIVPGDADNRWGRSFTLEENLFLLNFDFCVLKFCFTCPLFRGVVGSKNKNNFFEW